MAQNKKTRITSEQRQNMQFSEERFQLFESIQEMIDIDKSLVNLPDLKEGESAYRKNKESIWLIRK